MNPQKLKTDRVNSPRLRHYSGSISRIATLVPLALVSMALFCPTEQEEQSVEDEIVGRCYSYAQHQYISDEQMTQAQCNSRCPTGECEVIQ